MWLAKLPTKGPQVIQGPGENAGVVDIGDGDAVVFKMESHNHPSFIEPYQGAATGVGGIMRDVFTMGARPIAILNALRFGDPATQARAIWWPAWWPASAATATASACPPSAARPTSIAATTATSWSTPCASAWPTPTRSSTRPPRGVGLPVVYVGSKTGRDGIHGATMASAEFDDDSAEKRPTVQVGDPFAEKLLIEACLELMASRRLVAIQDMGAAGPHLLVASRWPARAASASSSTSTTCPSARAAMTAYEMMLSESQERMLAILKPGREPEAEPIFRKWGLDVAVIGDTTDTGHLVLKHNGEVVADVPLAPLFRPRRRSTTAPGCRPPARGSLLARAAVAAPECMPGTLKLMGAPDMALEALALGAVRPPRHGRHPGAATGADAGIVRVHGTKKALAATSDVTPRYVLTTPTGRQAGGGRGLAQPDRAWAPTPSPSPTT